jgi:galactokinase/mevalonate kinase-like predicted kinase
METIRGAFGQMFDQKSRFSAADLGHIFAGLDQEQRIDWISGIMMAIRRHTGFALSRLVHTAGSALKASLSGEEKAWNQCLQSVYENLDENEKKELISIGFVPSSFEKARTWSIKARDVAFDNLSRTIVWSKKSRQKHPRCAVHADEIIWGQAPARLDLGGGWTDTPPYALEHGGSVINAAVNLEGKPPIHVHARILEDPVIRIISADHESEVIVQNLKELKDYGKADSKFGLAKAALVLSGFSIETASWPNGIKTLESMLECFGGGIELKTSAAIPSGSGLGTSSIMGAVLISVINRLTGKDTSRRELFNRVLQLEQELTTGGGWQDQIGGTIGGVKMISTEPGLVPDPKIRPVRSDLLDPEINQGQTLLYYTRMRRLAKNILRNIVGHYLDRDRATMEVLQKLHVFPPYLVDAMESVDMERFGNLVDSALRLKKEIDPGSSNPEMEKILERLKPYMNGATFLGAGGGGFLLVVCKSPEDALMAKKKLETDPPNPEARFFDYSISTTGLEVSVG